VDESVPGSANCWSGTPATLRRFPLDRAEPRAV